VLDHPQVGIAAQLLVDRPGQPADQPDHGEPGVQFRIGQPPRRWLFGTAAGSFGHWVRILIHAGGDAERQSWNGGMAWTTVLASWNPVMARGPLRRPMPLCL